MTDETPTPDPIPMPDAASEPTPEAAASLSPRRVPLLTRGTTWSRSMSELGVGPLGVGEVRGG